MNEPTQDQESVDPPSARDTLPIHPLKPWASRIFVTLALLAAAALGILAARMMRDMSEDPSIQARFEAIEQMRLGNPDSTADALPESSAVSLPDTSATGADSSAASLPESSAVDADSTGL